MNAFRLAATAAAATVASLAGASTLYGTGQNLAPGTRDSNWRVVAGPAGFTPNPGDSFSGGGYDSYVISDIPWNWLGGSFSGGHPGYTVGTETYRWISARDTSGSLVPGTYRWIAAQTFTVLASGWYDLNFSGGADERMEFFIDGSLDFTDPLMPTIAGGDYIGMIFGFTSIMSISNSVYLTAGEHTAYMTLYDTGFASGALITQASFTASNVPLPGAAGIAAIGLAGLSRRRRR